MRRRNFLYYLLAGGVCLLVLFGLIGIWFVQCGQSGEINYPAAYAPNRNSKPNSSTPFYEEEDRSSFTSPYSNRPKSSSQRWVLNWNLPDLLIGSFPDSELNPFEEQYSDFFARVPWARYIIEPAREERYGILESYQISRFTAELNDDGEPSVKIQPLLIVDRINHEGSVVASSATEVPVAGLDNKIPLFAFACDAADMPLALHEARRWMDRYAVIQKGRYDHIDDAREKRRLLEEQLREFDALLNSQSNFIILQPNVRAALDSDRAELQEEIDLL